LEPTPKGPVCGDALCFRNLARVKLDRQLFGEEIQQVNIEAEFSGKLFQQVAARRMALIMLYVIQVRTGNGLAVFVLDAGGKLPLGQVRLLARLHYHLAKCSHIPHNVYFVCHERL